MVSGKPDCLAPAPVSERDSKSAFKAFKIERESAFLAQLMPLVLKDAC